MAGPQTREIVGHKMLAVPLEAALLARLQARARAEGRDWHSLVEEAIQRWVAERRAALQPAVLAGPGPRRRGGVRYEWT